MNERYYVAVNTVTGLGHVVALLTSKLRCDFSVTMEWQQVMNAIRWIKQFTANSRQSLWRLSERGESSAYCNATQYGIHVVTG